MKTTQQTFGTPEEALWLYKFSGTRKASWEEIVEVPKLTFSVPIISNAARKDNISSFFLEACWHKCTPVSFYIFNLNNSSRRGRMKHREKTVGKHHGKEGRGGARIGKNQLNSREKRKEENWKTCFKSDLHLSYTTAFHGTTELCVAWCLKFTGLFCTNNHVFEAFLRVTLRIYDALSSLSESTRWKPGDRKET